MGAGRGGARQGTRGRSYSNRTDLANNYAGPKPVPTPAPVQNLNAQQPQFQGGGQITPDMVTPLDAPTSRPGEPVTHGLPIGAGGGPEALGVTPPDPMIASVQAAFLANPTPQLRRALNLLMSQGAV